MERTSRNNYWSCQHRGLQACLEGPGQAPLSIWTSFNFFYFYITSTNSLHCFLAHIARAQHISAEDGLYCPLQIRNLDLDLNLHRVFTPEDLFFTCIALRWLNSWLFLETSGSSSNFNQPHKWSGILKCFSLQKGVFSFRINEWTRSCISLPP